MWHWTNDEIEVAVESWLWVRAEQMESYLIWLERLNRGSVVVDSNPTQAKFL